MSDATYVELPPQPNKAPLWRSWRGIVLLTLIICVILAAWFSWWLAEGKVTSSFARVDATVYTVDVNYPAVIDGIMTRQGDLVAEGQALARIDSSEYAAALQRSAPVVAPENNEIAGRLAASAEAERRMAVRLAEARAEEERYRQIHQQRVTEHVRQQIYLRSINPGNFAAWEQASRAEEMARSRMEAARDDFERVSKMRAAVDTELNRIRYELTRAKNQAPAKPAPSAPAPPPQPKPELPNMLYAPVNGEVFSIEAQPGERVQPGQTIFIILPRGESGPNEQGRWIQAWFPANTRKELKKGQKAQIAIRDHILPGIVSEIDPQDQIMPRGASQRAFVPVRIQLKDQEILENITPGTNAECQIQTHYLLSEKYF